MIPLVDIHVHLLAAMDDGPRTLEDAVAMCRMAGADGVRTMAATSHQNHRWCDVTPEGIRVATAQLRAALVSERIPVEVVPNAEITAAPETPLDWQAGKLLSAADQNQYLLVEMPKGVFVDLLPTVRQLRKGGIRTILAHPEKEPDFLYGEDLIEAMIEAGCLVQVSASSVTDPKNHEDSEALQNWFKRGMVHLLASDGHSPRRRPPLMADAFREIVNWVGISAAERIGSGNGLAIINGERVRVRRPLARERKKSWFAGWW